MAIVIVLFLVTFLTILLCVKLATSFFKAQQKQQIRSMLRNAESTSPVEVRGTPLLRAADVQDGLTRLLRRFQFVKKLDLIIEQSGQNFSGSRLLVIAACACAAGLLLGLKFAFFSAPLAALIFGGLGGALPFVIVMRKRSKNIGNFEKQLPEALDFLARSMRAGHGFSIALEMLAADSPDPTGAAFRRVSNDLQLGSSLEIALNKLLVLVPLVDVRFFVSSVLLQQETGGNLGEILSKLAQIIRERFRLKGAVKAASAHGRITGMVLVLMPIVVCMIMMVTSPSYLKEMAADKVGRLMIYGAIVGQFIGYFVIKKIINIKV
jgi:tight adherence protein B